MIGSLRGRLLDRGADGELLIEVGGVGHRVQVTPSTSVTIGEVDGDVFVHTHHAVRDRADSGNNQRLNLVAPFMVGKGAEELATSVRTRCRVRHQKTCDQ